MSKRIQIHLITFFMFFIIPPAGFLSCYCTGLWPGHIIPKLLDNPFMGVFTVVYLSGVWSYSNNKLKTIEACLKDPDAPDPHLNQ